MKQEQKLISVIMPAYNCENYVAKAIDCILNQTYKNFELLIADDCSKDNTKKIIDSYIDSRIKTFHNEVNLGYLKASNKLFKLCKGEYITFQDADDYSDITRLEKLVTFLEANSEVDCVGSNVRKIDLNDKELGATSFPLFDKEIRQFFFNYRVVFTGSALMLKKRVIEKVGIYNEYFDRIGSEDIYMFSHILDNFKVANLLEPLYFYRTNPNSVTSNHKKPKAFIGHNLILFFYKRRKNNQEDFIATGQWKKADNCANYFIAINSIKKSRSGAIIKFLNSAFSAPSFFHVFFKKFLYDYKLSLSTKNK